MKTIISALLLAAASGMAGAAGNITEISLNLQRVQIDRSYEDVVDEFEQRVPAMDVDLIEKMVDSKAGADEVTAAIKTMAGDRQLVRFYRIRAGDLFTVLGGSRVESVKYIVGNVFIAQQLFARNLTAGLHVPFAVNIYGRDGATVVEYFQPSSFLALVGNDAAINGIGQRLDNLMSELIHELEG